jgi:uncharacterized protein YkwD
MGVWSRLAAVVAACLTLLVCCSSASASVACPGDDAQPTEASAYDSVMQLVCDMNELRARNGVRPLRWDWKLWYAAQNHAVDMASRHYFAHVSPEGRGLSDRVEPTGYIPDYLSWTLSENLGFGTSMLSSPLAIATGWMNSEHHRENLLDPEVDDVGVGFAQGAIADGGPTGIVYVVDYGAREIDAAPTPRAATTVGQTPTVIPHRTAHKVWLRARHHRARRR